MSTATVEPTTELKVYKPSDSLMKLSDQIKVVAGFDPSLIPVFQRATQVAAVKALMSHPEMKQILDALEGSKAGFSSDLANEGKKYPPNVRDACVTTALCQGAHLHGNEWGIIKSNAFLQKPFYMRMLDELGKPESYTRDCKYEMLWWDPENGEIGLNGSMAKIPIKVSYKVKEKNGGRELSKTFERTIQIRTFPSDGPDKWIGQAERRVFQKLLRYLSGIDFGEDDDEGGTVTVPPPVGTMSLGKKEEPTQAPAAEEASFTPVQNQQEAQAAANAIFKDSQGREGREDIKLGSTTVSMPIGKQTPGQPPHGASIESQGSLKTPGKVNPPPETKAAAPTQPAPAAPAGGVPPLF